MARYARSFNRTPFSLFHAKECKPNKDLFEIGQFALQGFKIAFMKGDTIPQVFHPIKIFGCVFLIRRSGNFTFSHCLLCFFKILLLGGIFLFEDFAAVGIATTLGIVIDTWEITWRGR